MCITVHIIKIIVKYFKKDVLILRNKILSVILISVLIILLMPNTFVTAEDDYFYGIWETDDERFKLTDATSWTFKRDVDSAASGGYTMKFHNLKGTFDGEKRLYYDELEVEKDGMYKLFVRIRKADAIKFSVNGGSYITKWHRYSDTEYEWLYMGEIELFSKETLLANGLGNEKGMNTINFAPHKNNTYFDKVAITNDPLAFPVGTAEDFSEGGGFSEVYPAPEVYPPKNSHPRVFINESNLETIKANLTHEQNINVYNQVLKYAKRNDTGLLSQSGTHNNYNYNALECAKSNAFLYLMDGDETKALKAINIMINYMSTLKYVPEGSLQEIRGTGGAIVVASIVYDWCHDAKCFTDEMKENLVYLCMAQADKLECGWPPSRLNGFTEGHGQENSVMKDMLAFAIAVYDEYPEIYDFVGGRVFEEYVPYMNNRYKDGDSMHSQGDNYGVGRFGYEIYLNLLFSGMGYDNVIDKNQQYMAYQQLVRTRPDGATFNDGDIFDHAVIGTEYKVITAQPAIAFYASVLFNDPYMKGFFQELMPYPEKMTLGDDFSPVIYLALNNTSLKGKSKQDLPLTIYGGDTTGMLTARTSWNDGKNSDAMLVSMKLPERWKNNHQHYDAGNFEIYYKGPLAIDSGLYTSAGNTHDLNYNRRTIAHNTMLVYKEGEHEYSSSTGVDGGQRGICDFPNNMTMENILSDEQKAGEVMYLDWGEDLNKPSYTYFKGDMTEWYSDKVSLFERSFMFLNFFDETYPGALIVFDKVVSSDASYKKSWLLHSQQEPIVNGNITTIIRDENGYNGKLINETLLPREFDITKVGGDGYEYYYGGVNYEATPKDTYSDESGNWRIELSPANANNEDYFLNVLTVSENNDEIIPLDAEFSENDLFYQVKIKDRVCFFPKNSELITDSFTISVSGEGEFEYAIANLSEGTWNIKGGDLSLNKEVTAKGSVLNFKVSAGTYEISKVNGSAKEKDLSLKANILTRNKPFIEAYPYAFNQLNNIAVFSKTMFDYGYNVSEYGFMYAEDENATLETPGVRKFPSNGEVNQPGQFGIQIIDHFKKLKSGYLLRPYIIYYDNGEQKTVYGKAIYP